MTMIEELIDEEFVFETSDQLGTVKRADANRKRIRAELRSALGFDDRAGESS